MSWSQSDSSSSQQQQQPLLGEDMDATKQDEENITRNVNVVQVKTKYGDKAAEMLETAGHSYVLTAADSNRILRKIDLRLLPIILIVYFLQQLDKSTLAYVSVFGLIKDTDPPLEGEEYSWLGSCVYIAQLVAQPIIAWALVRLPNAKFCFVMVLCWGIVLSCMAAATNFTGLLITRTLLGCFEASVAPTFVNFTQNWWRRSEQTNRMALWYSMNGITNMFGSLLVYGLAHIPSSLHTYQIVFLFCGCITVAFSFVIYFFLPDAPMTARFFSTNDKVIAVERVRMNQMGVSSGVWRLDHVKESIFDPKSWAWFALIFSVSIPSGGITTFGPLIVNSFGFSPLTTILFNIPFGFVQIIATLGGSFFATRLRKKGPVIALLCIPPIAGCAMLMTIDHTTGSKAALLIGYYLISFYPGISPLIYSWQAQNTAGDTKRKVTSAIVFIGQSAGNIIGPHLYTTAEAPGYHRGLISNLILYIVIIVVTAITTVYLKVLNKSHAKRRVLLGKASVVVDESMVAVKDIEPSAEELEVAHASDVEPGVGIRPARSAGNKAFDDLTDGQNEDFIFVY